MALNRQGTALGLGAKSSKKFKFYWAGADFNPEMDRKEALAKLKEKMTGGKVYLKKALMFALLVGLGFGAFKFISSNSGNPVAKGFKSVKYAAHSLQEKVDEINHIQDANRRLKLENMNLRRWAESLKFSCSANGSKKQTRKTSMRLAQETGERVGRTLASISYRPPTHLLPREMYTLGVSYLKGQEDEKAAVILTFLTGLEEDQTYKTPENYLMAGVAWYRLDHNKLASEYFDKVLDFKRTSKNERYLGHARLWKALTARKASRGGQSQYWLRQVLDHHPRSEPANWVNPTGLDSAGAKEQSSEKKLAQEHHPKKASHAPAGEVSHGAAGPAQDSKKKADHGHHKKEGTHFGDHGANKVEHQKVNKEEGHAAQGADGHGAEKNSHSHGEDHGSGASHDASHDSHH